MINIELYFKNDNLYRFSVNGHANFSEHGSDIVCAGVSTLVLNTINSIDKFLDEPISLADMDKNKGVIDCSFDDRLNSKYNPQTTILLQSMVFGLETMEQMYGEYITINRNTRR